MKKENLMVIACLIVSLMFGMASIFIRQLDSYGFIPMQISFIRYSFATVILVIIALLTNRSNLAVRKKDVPLFIVFGIINTISHNTNCLAISSIPVGFATVLQMTAPFYVMIFSYFLFKERITPVKIFAVLLGIFGCMAIGGVLSPDFGDIDTVGIVAGIISGFAYAFVLMGGKIFADRGYKPQTSLIYMFMFAALSTIPLCNFTEMVEIMARPDVYWIAPALGMSVLVTVIPYLVLYKAQECVDATLVSVISIAEVVGAVIVGAVVFGESIGFNDIIGIIYIFIAVLLMNFGFSKLFNRKVRRKKDSGEGGTEAE